MGPILIENNTLIGGYNSGNITNHMSNGIYVFGGTLKDVIIRNNVITRTGQSGIRMEGSRIRVLNNRMTDVGGGGALGFFVMATDSEIIGNTFTFTNQPADGTMLIMPGSARNVFRD